MKAFLSFREGVTGDNKDIVPVTEKFVTDFALDADIRYDSVPIEILARDISVNRVTVRVAPFSNYDAAEINPVR